MRMGEFEPSMWQSIKPQRGVTHLPHSCQMHLLGSAAKQARTGAFMEDVDHSHKVLELCWQGM